MLFYLWIQTGVTVQKRSLWFKIIVFWPIWHWNLTLKNNRAHLLCHCKFCTLFSSHLWIQTGVTVQRRLNWDKIVLISVTLTFDHWPWPFAWTSPLSIVIAPENFTMIRRAENSEKGVTGSRLVVSKNRWFFRLGMKLMLSFIHSFMEYHLPRTNRHIMWCVCERCECTS